MSYWVSLHDTSGGICEVPPFDEGGTRVLGGSGVADLNVTYNYGECYRLVPAFIGSAWPIATKFSISVLDGRTGAEAEAILAHVVEVLGDEPYKTDYWAPTPGNAGHAAAILLGWAKLYPDATFEVH